MNFLAHIYLSGDNDQIRIGNFMADSIKGKKYLKYPEDLQKGIVLHRAIDYYTDTHPVFRQSTQRLFSNYSHYSGIIVDIFYDHFLAANWENYSEVPLEKYTLDFYKLLNENFEVLPGRVKNFLPYMINDNWLLSYASIDGIEKVLSGMNRRTGRKSNMNEGTRELKKYYPEFKAEFENFFEDIILFSEEKLNELNTK
ncbi:acyl carrier protein phosphodiesterase [Christiangramia gaetbulicola]|uniref:Acyl carrier protein phosphodiesterase n=1 Tax=Christiangramia gaetbulicola TaxID=703340 RepID=A0A2T6AFK9_9FLAO|nr:acyl carrier protein phosphodiesterase [Christiangramia gaetbulicola]PTX42579.1 acyl carrier protein phosphodiesterase [Christiangramia gaetbulicola]